MTAQGCNAPYPTLPYPGALVGHGAPGAIAPLDLYRLDGAWTARRLNTPAYKAGHPRYRLAQVGQQWVVLHMGQQTGCCVICGLVS